MRNAFTVDLEDWYQGLEMGPELWGGFEDRLRVGTERLLQLLESSGARATFFVLGAAAERHPQLVREIHDRGHEIGTHGYGHHFVYRLGADGFRDDLRRSLDILGSLVGEQIRGHRAPFFSIVEGSEWAFDVLAECGLAYDSSVFPVRNYRYGMPRAPRWVHRLDNGLTEFPLSTLRMLNRNIPACGGAYFRLLPYILTRRCIGRLNRVQRPAVFYIHPWELDPDQPRIDLPLRVGLTHYWNLGGTQKRLEQLLREFEFGTMAETLGLEYG